MCVAIVFFVYDLLVQRRNENLVSRAAQSNAIVASIFPDNIRDRLMHEKEGEVDAPKRRSLKAFLSDSGSEPPKLDSSHELTNKPLADLFLDVTVLFADIAGFTAWSSVREPTHVCFGLLDTSSILHRDAYIFAFRYSLSWKLCIRVLIELPSDVACSR